MPFNTCGSDCKSLPHPPIPRARRYAQFFEQDWLSDAVGGLMCYVNWKCFRHTVFPSYTKYIFVDEAGPCAASGVLLICKPTSTCTFCCCASVTWIYSVCALNLLWSNFSLCLKYAILFIHILVQNDGFVWFTILISSCVFPSKMLDWTNWIWFPFSQIYGWPPVCVRVCEPVALNWTRNDLKHFSKEKKLA